MQVSPHSGDILTAGQSGLERDQPAPRGDPALPQWLPAGYTVELDGSGPVVHMLNQFPGRFLFRLRLDSSTAPGGVSGKAAIERGASEDNGNDCCGGELICSAPQMGPCWNLKLRGRGSWLVASCQLPSVWSVPFPDQLSFSLRPLGPRKKTGWWYFPFFLWMYFYFVMLVIWPF